MLRNETEITERWKEYYEALLNEENERCVRNSGYPHQGLVQDISKEEVVLSLKRMKVGKAPGPDNLPVEAWKALGEEGVSILWQLMNKIFLEEKIPDSWR